MDFRVLLWVSGCVCYGAQTPPAWITSQQRTKLELRVRGALPPGWTITRTVMNRIPDGWVSSDLRGFEIDGKNGEQAVQVWFLPREWVGIRVAEPGPRTYPPWERCWLVGGFKAVSHTDQETVQEGFWRHLGAENILTAGRWEAFFMGRAEDVDGQTQALVNRQCKDRACRDAATLSLLGIGVPARTLTLDCAAHGLGQAQRSCVWDLLYVRGRESVNVLDDVVSGPASSPDVRMTAAMVLGFIGDPASGPALLKGLGMTTWSEALWQIANAIALIHYQPAAPEILSLATREPTGWGYYFEALASLRYRPAVAIIRPFCKTTRFSADWLIGKQDREHRASEWFLPTGVWPEMSLLRLTEPWGAPSHGIRLLLLPAGGLGLRLAVLAENCGDRNLEGFLLTPGEVIVDGKRYKDKDPARVFDGNFDLRINVVAARILDLSRWIGGPGIHRVQWKQGTAVSNEVTVWRWQYSI